MNNPTTTLTEQEKKDILEQAEKALSGAKINLIMNAKSVFFTTLAFNLNHLFNWNILTVGVKGKDISYNPQFFLSLSRQEQVFLILHGTLHVAYLHTLRIGNRNHRKWNIAGDYVINNHLIEQGFTMPQGGLADPQYKDMTTEQVYDLLPDSEDPNTPKLPWEDLTNGSENSDEEEKSSGSSQALEQEIENLLVQAHIQAQLAGQDPGSIPGDLRRVIDKLVNPKLPWHQILRRFLNQLKKEDYSWRRPNKRFLPDYYLPSLYSEGMGEVAIAIDTSGSISEKDFNFFITEVASILKLLKPSSIKIIQFDYGIRSIQTIKSFNELLSVPFKGGGGTDITQVVDWVNENKPEFIVWLTDGYFDFPETLNRRTPTFWVIHDNPRFTAPYGEVVHYEIPKNDFTLYPFQNKH